MMASRVSFPERGAYSTPRRAPKPSPARNHMKLLPLSLSDILRNLPKSRWYHPLGAITNDQSPGKSAVSPAFLGSSIGVGGVRLCVIAAPFHHREALQRQSQQGSGEHDGFRCPNLRILHFFQKSDRCAIGNLRLDFHKAAVRI